MSLRRGPRRDVDILLVACGRHLARVQRALQYIPEPGLPDKALDVPDEAVAQAQLEQRATLPESTQEVRKELRRAE